MITCRCTDHHPLMPKCQVLCLQQSSQTVLEFQSCCLVQNIITISVHKRRWFFAVFQHCSTQKSHADDECSLSRCIFQFPHVAIIRLDYVFLSGFEQWSGLGSDSLFLGLGLLICLVFVSRRARLLKCAEWFQIFSRDLVNLTYDADLSLPDYMVISGLRTWSDLGGLGPEFHLVIIH